MQIIDIYGKSKKKNPKKIKPPFLVLQKYQEIFLGRGKIHRESRTHRLLLFHPKVKISPFFFCTAIAMPSAYETTST